jgi:hypothetical protein
VPNDVQPDGVAEGVEDALKRHLVSGRMFVWAHGQMVRLLTSVL